MTYHTLNLRMECRQCQQEVNETILFECECEDVFLCKACGVDSLLTYKETFHMGGLLCPVCHKLSSNIKNLVDICDRENELLECAFERFLGVKSRVDPFSLHDLTTVFEKLRQQLNSFKSVDAALQLKINCNPKLRSLSQVSKTDEELKNNVGVCGLRLDLARLESALQAGRHLNSMYLGPLAVCEFKLNPLMSTILRLKEETKQTSPDQKVPKEDNPRLQDATDIAPTDIVELREQLSAFDSSLKNFQSKFPDIITDAINRVLHSQRQIHTDGGVPPRQDDDNAGKARTRLQKRKYRKDDEFLEILEEYKDGTSPCQSSVDKVVVKHEVDTSKHLIENKNPIQNLRTQTPKRKVPKNVENSQKLQAPLASQSQAPVVVVARTKNLKKKRSSKNIRRQLCKAMREARWKKKSDCVDDIDCDNLHESKDELMMVSNEQALQLHPDTLAPGSGTSHKTVADAETKSNSVSDNADSPSLQVDPVYFDSHFETPSSTCIHDEDKNKSHGHHVKNVRTYNDNYLHTLQEKHSLLTTLESSDSNKSQFLAESLLLSLSYEQPVQKNDHVNIFRNLAILDRKYPAEEKKEPSDTSINVDPRLEKYTFRGSH